MMDENMQKEPPGTAQKNSLFTIGMMRNINNDKLKKESQV
jgi:hypothetical protein